MKARRVGRPVEIAGTYLIILARRKELRRVSVPPFTNGHRFRSALRAGDTPWVVSRWRRRPRLLCILVPGHPLKTRVACKRRRPPVSYGLSRTSARKPSTRPMVSIGFRPAIQTDRSSSFRMPLSHVYPKPDKRTEKGLYFGAGRKDGDHRDGRPAFPRMDKGVSNPRLCRAPFGPDHKSSTHRDGNGGVPLPANDGKGGRNADLRF